jgi:hypothetical protein
MEMIGRLCDCGAAPKLTKGKWCEGCKNSHERYHALEVAEKKEKDWAYGDGTKCKSPSCEGFDTCSRAHARDKRSGKCTLCYPAVS